VGEKELQLNSDSVSSGGIPQQEKGGGGINFFTKENGCTRKEAVCKEDFGQGKEEKEGKSANYYANPRRKTVKLMIDGGGGF